MPTAEALSQQGINDHLGLDCVHSVSSVTSTLSTARVHYVHTLCPLCPVCLMKDLLSRTQ